MSANMVSGRKDILSGKSRPNASAEEAKKETVEPAEK